jgi:DNA-3-methyladenine glycosylase I
VSAGIAPGEDGRPRCGWAVGDPLYETYHDTEWGRGVTDDRRLFEKIVLEGFQAGLAWITVLRKRERFREVFAGFDPDVVAGFGESDVERLLGDAGIIRHRGKIEAAISNAATALETAAELGSLAAYFWRWGSPDGGAPQSMGDVPAITGASTDLSKDLKRRGWRFVGPTTVYAFMQAMGLVNDHLAGCWVRAACEPSRAEALQRFGG